MHENYWGKKSDVPITILLHKESHSSPIRLLWMNWLHILVELHDCISLVHKTREWVNAGPQLSGFGWLV